MRTALFFTASAFASCMGFLACSGTGSSPVDGGPPDATDGSHEHHDSSHPPGDASMDRTKPHDAADSGSPGDADAADVSSDATDAPGDAPLDAGDGNLGETGPDTGPPDAGDGGDAGNPSLCGPSFLFCDGFENGLGAWSKVYELGGAPSADKTHVYRGSYALRAHIDAIGDGGAADAAADGGAPGPAYAYVQQFQAWPTHVFTRLFVYQPSPHPSTPSAVLDMLGGSSPYPGIELLTDPPSGGLGMKTYSTGADQAWQSEAGAITPDQWVCFELEVDTTAETSHLYMNDVEVTDLAQTGLALPTLGILGVGLSFLNPSPQAAQDVWIDEVAVNTTRIGCSM